MLSHNSLRDIPSSVALLVNLQTLLLDNNELAELPDGLGQLTKLHTLCAPVPPCLPLSACLLLPACLPACCWLPPTACRLPPTALQCSRPPVPYSMQGLALLRSLLRLAASHAMPLPCTLLSVQVAPAQPAAVPAARYRVAASAAAAASQPQPTAGAAPVTRPPDQLRRPVVRPLPAAEGAAGQPGGAGPQPAQPAPGRLPA